MARLSMAPLESGVGMRRLGILFLAGSLLGFAGGAVARGLPFAEDVNVFDLDKPIFRVIPADFNNDGLMDFVALTRSSGGDDPPSSAISVGLNNGTSPPTFSRFDVITDNDSYFYGIGIGDVDGDGDLDVLSQSPTETNMPVWYRNDGTGTVWGLIQPGNTRAGRLYKLATDDMDLDGDEDVVVSSSLTSGGANYNYLRNANGAGTSWTEGVIDTDAPERYENLEIADFDLNGRTDVFLELLIGSGARLYYQNTNGTFSDPETVLTNNDFRRMLSGDIDRDGDIDIVALADSPTGVFIAKNNRELGFDSSSQTINASGNPSALIDIDRDGDLDVCGMISGTDNSVFYDNIGGDGSSFQQRFVGNTFSGNNPVPMDVDNDGDYDLLGYSNAGHYLYIYENVEPKKKVEYPSARILINDGTPGAREAKLADLDRDGDLDMACAVAGNDVVLYALNNGESADYSFSSSRIVVSGSFANEVNTLDFGDVNKDGWIDIILSSPTGGIRFARNNDPTGPAPFLTSQVAPIEGIKKVAVGDLDGDGDLDIVATAVECTGTIPNVTCNGYLYLIRQTGDPTSVTGWTSEVLTSTHEDMNALDLGDIDNDGDLDIVAGTFDIPSGVGINSQRFNWYENDGNSTPGFTARTVATSLSGFAAPDDVQLVDFDFDGDLDVAGTGLNDDGAYWYENLDGAGGSWSGFNEITTGGDNTTSIQCADFDHDGDMDAVVVAKDDNAISVYQNDGQGNFSYLYSYEEEDEPDSVDLGDINQDGVMDILATWEGDGSVAFFDSDSYHFELGVTDIAPTTAEEAEEIPLFKMDLEHFGRTGDLSMVPFRLSFFFKNEFSSNMDSDEFGAIFDSLVLWQDTDNSGDFSAGDIRVGSVDYEAPENPVITASVTIPYDVSTGIAVPAATTGTFFLGMKVGAAAGNKVFSVQMVQSDDPEISLLDESNADLIENEIPRPITTEITVLDTISRQQIWTVE